MCLAWCTDNSSPPDWERERESKTQREEEEEEKGHTIYELCIIVLNLLFFIIFYFI